MAQPESPPKSLPTIGAIADRCGKKVHQVVYAIRCLGVKPVARAGRLRVFSEEDVARVAAELDRMAGPRGEETAQ